MITTSKKFFALPMLMGALFVAGATQNAHAATDTAQADLHVDTIAEITVTNNLDTFTPVRADYVAGKMEQPNAISLNVFANKAYTVTVDGQADGATLLSNHLFVKPHSAGAYAGAISTQQVLASSEGASAVAGDNIPLDVKVVLPDAGTYAPGSTYSNTMVFTVTAGS